jgi:glyoxylate carboligase
MNNIGYIVDNKRQFQSEYKFSIAFENNAHRPQYPGYTTEKIMEPMTVNSIPIYWEIQRLI